MESVKLIRDRLKLSQKELAGLLGKPQSSVSTYEAPGANIPTDAARKLIEVARARGLLIDFNHLYGDMPLPPEFKLPSEAAPAPAAPTAQQLVIRRRSA